MPAPAACPPCLTAGAFRRKGCRPAGHASRAWPGPDSLVSDSRRGGGKGGGWRAAAEEASALGGLREGGHELSSPEAGRCGGGRGVESSVHPCGRQEKRPIRRAWPRPHPLCHPPPRLSSRQRLSGPFGGARQMACPRACGQRQRVSRAQLRGMAQHTRPEQTLERNWALTAPTRERKH